MTSLVQLPPVFREAEYEIAAKSLPYHLADQEFPKHWESTGGGAGILVGICDTGLDETHPEIRGKVQARASFVSRRRGEEDAGDENGHGTHVATTIAGDTVGVAPKAELAIAKVLGANGVGSNAGVARGITWLVNEGCRIINLSLGGSEDDPATREAIQGAIAAGVLVIAATGNERANMVGYPARHCIAVGAVDRGLKLADFSNRGKDVDLVGYGVSIFAGIPGGRYAEMSGTSMATPFIAGCAANRLSAELKHRGQLITTSAEKLLALETMVTDLGPAGRDSSYGRGFPDLKRAFYERIVETTPPANPPVTAPAFISEPILCRLEGVASGRLYTPVTIFPQAD